MTAGFNTRAWFKALRALLRKHGAEALENELAARGLVKDGKLTIGEGSPFNLFARIGGGDKPGEEPTMSQPECAASNDLLSKEARRHYVVCCNLPKNDENWWSTAKEWVGTASMSKHHRFLTVRDLNWRWFNAVSFGIGGGDELRFAITRMQEVLATAKAFAEAEKWSSNVGFFFHVYPHNSVQSFHLHMVDLAVTGPTYEVMKYKNIPAEEVLAVLRAEALLEAVRGLKAAEPNLGLEPLLAKLRKERPDLGAATKNVQVALAALKAELLEAVRGLKAAEPKLGLKPLLAKLRQQQPDLGAETKNVQVALAALKAESKAP